MISLDADVSQIIVTAMVEGLGQARVAEILSVSDRRLFAFTTGRGRLSFEVLDRITAESGKSWRRWLIDSTESAFGPEHGRFVEATRKLVASLDASEVGRLSPRKPARSRRRTPAA